MKTPTGRIDHDGDRHTLVITRTFPAPIEDVWAAVTEPERLERWIGTYTGDPASGEVQFAMTAEGEDAPADEMRIRECDPPRRLWLSSRVGEEFWDLELDLEEADGVTTVTFRQPGHRPGRRGERRPRLGVLPGPVARHGHRRRRRCGRLRPRLLPGDGRALPELGHVPPAERQQ